MRKKGNIPRITCSSFSPDFGDLANFMEILQEIEVTSKHLVQENICVAPAEVESIEINNGADSPTKPIEKSEIKISENGSNWDETEKWFDENKKGEKSTVAKDIDQKLIENDDEEETVNVVQSEFT